MSVKRNKTQQQPDPAAKFWRIAAVCKYTGRARSSIYADETFPRPVKLGHFSSAWVAAEVIAWCEARIAERGEASRSAA